LIRFGPSGIPLSCKGRTPRDGIEDVHTLGLNAMEIQFVRVNVFDRYASEEEEGLTPMDMEGELVVDVMRYVSDDELEPVWAKNLSIEEGDVLRTLTCGIGNDFNELKETGKLARELDVELSLHTPYYMDLSGDEEIALRSLNNVVYGGLIADALGAGVVVTHMGLYGDLEAEEATEAVVGKMEYLTSEYSARKVKARIGLETSGKQVVYGSLDEILDVVSRVRGTLPVLNIPHIHAREHGSLQTKDDFQEVFDRSRKASKLKWHYAHFSGVQHESGNEKRYTPIKKGDLKFEPLAECVLDNDFNITIISSSPLLEHDAMYMKVILERVMLKREAKVQRMMKEAAK
jgi:deoxyribonuclease-4